MSANQPLTALPEYTALARHASLARQWQLRDLFAQDAQRASRFTLDVAGLCLDYSKNHVDGQAIDLLAGFARAQGVEALRDAMFNGEAINLSEKRPALHTLLRVPPGTRFMLDGVDAAAEVHRVLDRMAVFCDAVRSGRWKGYSGQAITDVVNIGIGGSDLGPQMATLALARFAKPGLRLHFVSNVDGHELDGVLQGLDPQRTLFLVASKTFTTLETMMNARSARDWFLARGGKDTARHFAALTTNVAAAREFGITTTFGFWDWVGGRYSLWSAIGLPLAIAIGGANFRALLAGAHAMDAHFATAPLARNLPLRLALIDVWYRNFHGFASRGLAPYHSGLRRLPAYLQQLEMESNGKRVDRQGRVLPHATSPVLWGEPGTNGQHAFFQMIHQGSDVVPMEFVAVAEAAHHLPGHQQALLANVLAQAQALMQGREDAGGHRHFPGNRPSTLLLLERLDPASLGALIALQEHRVFCSGALWGVNSFDQWGVELGKVLAKDITERLSSGETGGLDGATAAWVARLARQSGA